MIRGLLCRIARMGALCGTLALLFIAAVPSATVYAAEGHVFDPTLSLTGSCQKFETAPDPVPDPGCPEGTHPPKPFSVPMAVTTDSYGNIYVASFGQDPEGKQGRIDIFNSEGFYIGGFAIEGPRSLAVDSKGNLYAFTYVSTSEERGSLRRYSPVAPYEPAVGNIKYNEKEYKVLVKGDFAFYAGLAIGPKDHLFMWDGKVLPEFNSAAEGNEIVNPNVGEGALHLSPSAAGLAIDLTRERIYAYDTEGSKTVIGVLELEEPYAPLETIDGSTTPTGKFSSFFSIGVDEGTGHIFVYDANHKGSEVVYELTKSGSYISSIDNELGGHSFAGAEIAVDNGKNSPNGVLNPFGVRYLFVPAYPPPVGTFSPLAR